MKRRPMRAFYYLICALRRLVGAGSSSAFAEWKMRLLLLWMESNVVVSLIFLVFREQIESMNRWLLALAVVAPLLVLNEYLLSDRQASMKYAKEFSALPRGKRITAYTCAALLVVGALILPLVLHAAKSDRPWWE